MFLHAVSQDSAQLEVGYADNERVRSPQLARIQLQMAEYKALSVAQKAAARAACDAAAKEATRQNVFGSIYRNTTCWGTAGGGSGPGSSPNAAREARDIVTNVVTLLNVTSMLDAACGSRVWQTPMVKSLQDWAPSFRYLGVDVTEEPLRRNVDPRLPTMGLDLVEQPVPRGYELIMAREVMQHNGLEDVRRMLNNFACSDARYLLMTSYRKTKKNVNVRTGEYFPINLRRHPFLLEPWMHFCESKRDDRWLNLYNRTSLKCVGVGDR